MSQKTKVIELYEAGKDYGEIEKETGAKRTYIRTIVSRYKKDSNTKGVGNEGNAAEDEQGESQGGEQEGEVNNDEMHFNNDIEDENNLAGDQMGDPKTGKEYHKAWVNAKAFECACGCTLNRRSKFCPNCGITLDWSGF